MNIQNPGFQGHVVRMQATNPLHYSDGRRQSPDDNVAGSFADALNSAVAKVNNLQVESEELTRRMIYEPESVNIHTVMIAAQKAEVAMTFTKSIRDEAIRAFRDLMNLR
ncbi:MAG TPA: flagellar hook-basal body complex protein FliE [Spirochaetota bacterium]|nr:flagellar hook-basal body complex protein FliE [Spirochaetota bacterium]